MNCCVVVGYDQHCMQFTLTYLLNVNANNSFIGAHYDVMNGFNFVVNSVAKIIESYVVLLHL